jgi:hypothetical protein
LDNLAGSKVGKEICLAFDSMKNAAFVYPIGCAAIAILVLAFRASLEIAAFVAIFGTAFFFLLLIVSYSLSNKEDKTSI